MAAHARELSCLAELAFQHGLRLAVEPIGGHTLCAGPDDALALIESAGNPDIVGLLVDSFHYFRTQIDDTELERIPLNKLLIIHVNDSEDGAVDELTDANRMYPLEGVIPLGDMLGRLVARGSTGWSKTQGETASARTDPCVAPAALILNQVARATLTKDAELAASKPASSVQAARNSPRGCVWTS